MRVITRNEQNTQVYGSKYLELTDSYFDGVPLPRTIRPRQWIPEGAVHRERILSNQIDSTRYFIGAQNCVVRDDNRRVTWAAFVEAGGKEGKQRLILHRFPGSWPSSSAAPPSESRILADGDVWRYHLALNKFSGEVIASWITRDADSQTLWLDGKPVETAAMQPDFPFYGFSQPPIGHVADKEPPFSMLAYKCRKTGRLFIRRVQGGRIKPESELKVGKVLGGVSFGISGDTILARVDVLKKGKLVPTLLTSKDAGKTFGKPEPLELSEYERVFNVVPGYSEPIVDVGGHFHVPIHVSDGTQSSALNYVVRQDTLTEAIRIDGSSRISNARLVSQALSQGALEVFPATLGNPDAFGDGVTDGHGLIMVLSAEGRLFSSNSSAGGIYFPEPALLNYEMPLIAAFASTECYTSGQKPNFVSMDYIYLEADSMGRPISGDLHMETWDMPLPVPQVKANGKGSTVEVTALADMDFEPGQVSFSFSDPRIRIEDVKVTSLRTATVKTDGEDLKGQTVRVDVDSLFHRHYAEAVVD